VVVVVQTTNILAQEFQKSGLDLDLLVNLFSEWKSLGAQGEDAVYEFGKDVPYERPHVNSVKNVLRHVHLVPILDVESKIAWDKAWVRASRRTSNRALVYVDDGPEKFLLIAILPEPVAHAVSRMLTPQDKAVMTRFAEIAESFIYAGKVIA
jgi:mRNA interferase YafO